MPERRLQRAWDLLRALYRQCECDCHIRRGSTCTETQSKGTVVTLTATPNSGYAFSRAGAAPAWVAGAGTTSNSGSREGRLFPGAAIGCAGFPRRKRSARFDINSSVCFFKGKAKMNMKVESCAICGCPVHRSGEHTRPRIAGHSHVATRHRVPERFSPRPAKRRGARKHGLSVACPWGPEKQATVYCYECHEALIHNPVLLPGDVQAFAELVKIRGLNEDDKPSEKDKIARRVMLLHEVLATGLFTLNLLEASHGGSHGATDWRRRA
jgi:hypothetical protein